MNSTATIKNENHLIIQIKPNELNDYIIEDDKGNIRFNSSIKVNLLFCMYKDQYEQMLEEIVEIASLYNDTLRVYVISDYILETTVQKLNLIGTPTLILFENSKEIGRLIGQNHLIRVIRFLNDNTNRLKVY